MLALVNYLYISKILEMGGLFCITVQVIFYGVIWWE